jgi:hypothetical protein
MSREADHRLLSVLALIVGFSAFEFLPNGNFNYLVFVLAGALLGCSRSTVLESARRARLNRQQAMTRERISPSTQGPTAVQPLS